MDIAEKENALKSGKKTQRVSMIAALNKGKIVAPMTFEGYCDTEVFNGWFEQFLAPILHPGQTVILDNATFHKSKKTVEFAKSVGVDILYLPPYSPDFNKIEHHWFPIKTESGKTFLFLNLFARLSTLLSFICSHYSIS